MNKKPPQKVIYKGEEFVLSQLAKEKGLALKTIKDRIERGMSVEDAIDTPKILSNGSQLPVVQTGIKPPTSGTPIGIRSQVTKDLFEYFATFGAEAFKQAVKEQVQDPATVLQFFKTYIAPLIPKDSLVHLDGEKTLKPIGGQIINIDKAYCPNLMNMEPI